MLKLMKYEFRKLRNTLLIMLAALAALEIGFLVGEAMEKTGLMTVSLVLISVLVFLVYAFIILAGMASYSRELKEKSGYLVFMVPVRPIGVVLSKLVFTAVAALAATAVFGAVAYFDFRYLIDKMDIDPDVMNQINMLLRFGLKANANVMQILRMAGFYALTMLIEILLTMCTAYLAITLSATMLQNKKGLLRALISLVLFVALTWGANAGIDGAVTFRKSGPKQLTLNGTNTTSGALVAFAGPLVIGSTGCWQGTNVCVGLETSNRHPSLRLVRSDSFPNARKTVLTMTASTAGTFYTDCGASREPELILDEGVNAVFRNVVLNGRSLAPGTWGGPDSPAQHKDGDHFGGSGVITVRGGGMTLVIR